MPTLIPDDPDIAFANALARFRQNGRSPLQNPELSAMQDAAQLDPLEDEPFLFAAMARMSSGESPVPLLEEGRRHNSRSREIRLLLLQQYLMRNSVASAIEEAGALSQLIPQGRSWLVLMVAALAESPRLDADTVSALQASPLRTPVLQKLAKDGAPAQRILQIGADMHASSIEGENLQWAGIIEQVAMEGDPAGARKLWSRFFGIKAADAIPFDGEFAGIAGPPFGWRISSGPAGTAEISNGSLRIRYFGRNPAEFARQLVTLSPGKFRLQFVAQNMGDDDQANLTWKITCAGGESLLDLPINTPTGPFHVAPTDTFSVPQHGCELQWLTLVGDPSLDADTRTAEIQSVTIDHG